MQRWKNWRTGPESRTRRSARFLLKKKIERELVLQLVVTYIIQWNAEIQTSEIGRMPKAKRLPVQISDVRISAIRAV